MPKVVDHAERRRELAGALWRIVRRDGIGRVSVRAVAAEAGTSPGALHYFATQDELAAFSLQAVIDAIQGRLSGLLPRLDPAAGALEVLEQYLPLDEQRRGEMDVYLAFLGRPHATGPLREIRESAEARSREGVLLALSMLASAGRVHPARDLEEEAGELYPFVDGLAVHGTLWPGRYPPAHLRRALRRRLAQLAAAPAPAPAGGW
jgi:AcrR family transcriptional regulator